MHVKSAATKELMGAAPHFVPGEYAVPPPALHGGFFAFVFIFVLLVLVREICTQIGFLTYLSCSWHFQGVLNRVEKAGIKPYVALCPVIPFVVVPLALSPHGMLHVQTE